MAILGISQVWITVGPIMVINFGLLISLIFYAMTGHSRNRSIHEAARRTASRFLSVYFKEWWVWVTDPIALMFVKMRMGPNVLTFIGFLLSIVAGILFAKGLFGYAGWAMIFGATFDLFDGRVARLSGRETRSGGYFDSVLDRFGEGVCFVGLAYYFRESWLLPVTIIGLIGSTMVSYTKARAEGMGVECKVGSMQRPERIVYMGVASIFTPTATILLSTWWTNPPPVLVIGALIIIALATNATAVYRMIYTMNRLDTDDKREIESLPQIITKLSTPEGRDAFWEKTRYGYDRSKSKRSHLVLFMSDGLDSVLLDRFMKRGDLPNISGYIASRGSSLHAISSFPSTTGTSTIPFITGCFPGSCDVPGVTWFDRTIPEARLITMNRFRDYLGWGAYAMDYDLSRTVRTLFEYSKKAVNIFGMVNRGCGLIRDPAFFRLHAMFRKAKREVDIEAVVEAAHIWFSEAIKRGTDCVIYSLPPADFISKSENADKALDSYRRIDEAIGKAVDLLKENGIYEETELMLSSGYSRVRCDRVFDFSDFLKDRYKIFTHPGKPREWLEAEAIVSVSGNSMAHIYLRENNSWAKGCFFEDIERRGLVGSLLEKEEIDILAGRSSKGGVVIASRRGRSHVLEDHDGRITYLVKGQDPFGYSQMPQVMHSEDALNFTCDSMYPDGIVQVIQIFRSQRSGDLVISAKKDTDITGAVDSPFTHGSLHRDHIAVPLISSIPFKDKTIRTADVFTVILKLFGIEPEHELDGVLPQVFSKDKSATSVMV